MIKIIVYFDRIGIYVQGTGTKPVRVRSYWRVRNGKKEFVKAHYRNR